MLGVALRRHVFQVLGAIVGLVAIDVIDHQPLRAHAEERGRNGLMDPTLNPIPCPNCEIHAKVWMPFDEERAQHHRPSKAVIGSNSTMRARRISPTRAWGDLPCFIVHVRLAADTMTGPSHGPGHSIRCHSPRPADPTHEHASSSTRAPVPRSSPVPASVVQGCARIAPTVAPVPAGAPGRGSPATGPGR